MLYAQKASRSLWWHTAIPWRCAWQNTWRVREHHVYNYYCYCCCYYFRLTAIFTCAPRSSGSPPPPGINSLCVITETSFFLAGCLSCHLTTRVGAMKGTYSTNPGQSPGLILYASTTRFLTEEALLVLSSLSSSAWSLSQQGLSRHCTTISTVHHAPPAFNW